MPAVAWFLVLILVGLGLGLFGAMLRASDPRRLLRALRDPRLVARVEARARELATRGWTIVPGSADGLPTIRHLRRAAPGCEAVALAIGCGPHEDWCRVEIVADIGVAPDVRVAPAVHFDRDGSYPLTPQIVQRRGFGFVVEPAEALARLPARLVEVLSTWPQAWFLMIAGRAITVRANVRGVGAIEAVVEEALARLVPRVH